MRVVHCNSHWRFQIVERFHPNQNEGCFELQVVDLNFTGKLNINDDKVPTYQLRGTTSPFIEVDFVTTTTKQHIKIIFYLKDIVKIKKELP